MRKFFLILFGSLVLFSLLTSSAPSQNNTSYGSFAGESLTTGGGNSFYGAYAGSSTTTGPLNSIFGVFAGMDNTTGEKNSFFGANAGRLSRSGTRNTFIGNYSGADKDYTGNFNTLLGASTRLASENVSYATAIGADAVAAGSNSVTLGRPTGEDMVRVPGNLVVGTLSTGGSTPLCRNAYLLVATCASSARYKSNIVSFGSGLDRIRHLRPVSFNWKDGGIRDLGLVAEEVAEVEPLLVTRNNEGEIEGVKYDRIAVVLVKAFQEQQRYIEDVEKQIDALKQLVCLRNRRADVCRQYSRR